MIPSIPHINKQSFESPGAEDSAGSKVFDFTDIINNCIYFNNGKALFRPRDGEEVTYGVDPDKSWAKDLDGKFVEVKNYRTNDGHKKAYILPTLFDIGFKSFRSTGSSFPADVASERIQLYNLSEVNGVERTRKLKENSELRDSHRYRLLPVRIKDGQIFDHYKGGVGSKYQVVSPGDLNYNIFDVFKNNHPVPKEDGYYVFIFGFSYMEGVGTIDDSAYQCYSAKVA